MYGEGKAPKSERAGGREITEYTAEDLEAMESRRLRLYRKIAEDGLMEIEAKRSDPRATEEEAKLMADDEEALKGFMDRLTRELSKRALADFLKYKLNYQEKEINKHA